MKPYDHKEVEAKWQKLWEERGVHKTPDHVPGKENFYFLTEFPYPSGNLHVGHWYAFSVPDIFVRYMRMRGYNMLYPIGFDAFGLPAENAAIKRGLNPKKWTYDNIAYMKGQLRSMGASFDWSREVITADPAYYKWTQWLFLELYKKGLVYRKETAVNWCPKDKTVLANEQVVQGLCERCDTPVEQRLMPQWNIKITDYADRLIDDLEALDWPKQIKDAQINWIGRSEGAQITFQVISRTSADGTEIIAEVDVFTTRPDTLFGATYMVLAPEHPLVSDLAQKSSNKDEVVRYVEQTKRKTELERTENKEKTGVELRGVKAVNPGNKEEIPIFIADYVLGNYGTGAIMAVPAHDERDGEFAKKFGLPMRQVVAPTFTLTGTSTPIEYKEYQKREVVSVILRDPKNDTYLLLKWPQKDICGFVGGGIEKGETYMEAADREIREETGYTDFKIHTSVFPVFYGHGYKPGKDVNCFDLEYFVVADLQSEVQTQLHPDDEGAYEILWVSKEKVEKLVTLSHHQQLWNHYHNNTTYYAGKGILINSSKFDGLDSEEAKKKITESVGGRVTKQYHLRDWVVSRQRFWGVPIPMIYCKKCGYNPVAESQLPVVLPEMDDYLPTGDGKSPLTKVRDWVEVSCPTCSGPAERETDTFDTFVDSSWYFLRYTDPQNTTAFASAEKLKTWMPVRIYSGGSEHTTMHVLYSRFWQKALYDIGLVADSEPYLRRMNRGLIMGPDGQKMSKSRGNVIDPDEVVERLGADTVRMYLAFIGPYNEVGTYPWNPGGTVGIRRFLERVWGLHERVSDVGVDEKTDILLNQTLQKVGGDIASLKMNTAVSALMILVNHLSDYKEVPAAAYKTLLAMLYPFAPHLVSEIVTEGHYDDALLEAWPATDTTKLLQAQVVIGVQINGKTRATIEIASDATEAQALALARADAAVGKWLKEGEEVKAIYVPGRIVNFVLRG